MVCGFDSLFGSCTGETLEISSQENCSNSGSDRGDTEATSGIISTSEATMLNMSTPSPDRGGNKMADVLDLKTSLCQPSNRQEDKVKRPSYPSPAK
ncbi:hypothetical protein HDE_00839 [Halotydeus destructor]|nr:hypothetical protein HDE_00839 [Halotydeus destructor]